ncbi:MAG: hypothetical protein ACJA13_000542 [Paraglaciecola sp.]|jgi:hypothetical protein
MLGSACYPAQGLQMDNLLCRLGTYVLTTNY